MEANKYGKRAM